MKLTPPKVVTYWIAVILGVLGILGTLGVLAVVGPYALWMLIIGFVLLALACLLKDL